MTDPLVVVQHHPARADIIGRLLDGCAPLELLVVCDAGGPQPDPWRCYLQCVRAALDSGHSHVVIVQDDATVCPDFAAELGCCIAGAPEHLLVLYLASYPGRSATRARAARQRGDCYAEVVTGLRDLVPVVGNCYPIGLLRELLDWSDAFEKRPSRSDDYMVGRWCHERQVPVLATIPSLVQHPDDVPSLIGNGAGAHGRNRARSALYFDV